MKSGRKIVLSSFCELLKPSHSTSKTCYPSKSLEDEWCKFCLDCYPLILDVEESRHQISILEEKIGKKVGEIRHKISSSPQVCEKIKKLRQIILQVTESQNSVDQEYANNVLEEEVYVKMEPDVNSEGDHVEDYSFSFSPTDEEIHSSNVVKVDPSEGDDDDESAFCIYPFIQKTGSGRQPESGQSRRLRRKREREVSSIIRKPAKPCPASKHIKLESRTFSARGGRVRISPRAKPTKVVKTLQVCLERLRPIKESLPKSDPSSEEDEDYNPKIWEDDKDWTPNKDHSEDDEKDGKTSRRREPDILCVVAGCTVKFPTIKARSVHMQEEHGGVRIRAPHQCTLCPKRFRRLGEFSVHLVVVHETGEKKFPCAKCGKSFALMVNLERHVELHKLEGVKPIVCDVCDSRFKDEKKLGIHLRIHDVKRCHLCGKVLKDKTALEKHVRTHTGERVVKCDQCDATFIDKITLTRHIAKAHSSGQAQHICHICGAAHYLLLDLKKHLDRHEGKFRVTCDTCGETFAEARTLQSHRVKPKDIRFCGWITTTQEKPCGD